MNVVTSEVPLFSRTVVECRDCDWMCRLDGWWAHAEAHAITMGHTVDAVHETRATTRFSPT